MISVAVDKVWGICPLGNIDELRLKLKSEGCSAQSFRGQCALGTLSELASLLPGVSLRRVPPLARLALRVALEVQSSTEVPAETSPHHQALVVSTAYGSVAETFNFLDSMLIDGPALASPTAFSHSVTNMTAAYLSQYLKITGPCLTVTQQSFIPALKAAAGLLASGQVDSVLLGAVSEFSEIMNKIEDDIFPQPMNTGEGAIFYIIRRPLVGANEVRINITDFVHPVADTGLHHDVSGEMVGFGNLGFSLRLALACCDAADGSTLRTTLSSSEKDNCSLIIEKSGEAS